MTEFYSDGTAGVTAGSKTITSVGIAVWISGNIRKGDCFQTAEIPPMVIETEPEYDPTLNGGDGGYKFDIAFEYAGSTNASIDYIIIKTSAEWGTNQTIAEQTAELIQGYSASAINLAQLQDAVEDAEAAEVGAEAAYAAIDAIYLGAKAADPTSNNQGGALANGMIYLNTVSGLLRLRNAGAWTNMLAGQTGAQGVGAGLQFAFASATSDADPGGPGNFRLNNSDHTLATLAYFDNTDVLSADVSAAIDAWGVLEDAAIKGTLFIVSKSNRAIYRAYFVTDTPVDKTGYREVSLTYIASAGTLVAATQCEIMFVQAGEPGTSGLDAPLPGVPMVFSTSTTDGDPGTGVVRANNATFGSITQLFFDNENADAGSIVDWLSRLDDVSNTVTRGRLRLQQMDTPANWMDFDVTGAVVDGGGYKKVPVLPISGAVFANGAEIAVNFSPAGPGGQDGADGTGSGISFNFDTTTTDSNPTSGGLRGNASDLSAASKLFVSKTSRANQNINAILQTFDDSNNPGVKGVVVLARSDEVVWAAEVTALTDATGYVKLDVQNPTANPVFANGDVVFLQFNRSGQQGGTGAGSGDVLSPDDPVSIGEIVAFALSDGTKLQGTGLAQADLLLVGNNFSDVGNKQQALDELFQDGATIVAAATLDLSGFAGPIGTCTGNTTITAVTLGDGDWRKLKFTGTPTIEDSASLILNTGGVDYNVQAGDVVEFFGRPGGVVQAIVTPLSGSTPGAMPLSYLDTDTALTADSDVKVPSQKAVKAFVPAAVAAAYPTLVSLEALTLSNNKGVYATAADTLATYDLTAAGRALAGGADVTAQRATLGLGDAATQTVLQILAAVYPVGCIYFSTNSTNPATSLGFGTWAEFGAGRVPVGWSSGDPDFGTDEATGGAKTHTLTTAQLPAHGHTFTTSTHGGHQHSFTTSTNGWHQQTFTTSWDAGHAHTWAIAASTGSSTTRAAPGGGSTRPAVATSSAGAHSHTGTTDGGGSHSHTGTTDAGGSHSHTGTTNDTGSGSAHNNIQPYIVVRMWKRTA